MRFLWLLIFGTSCLFSPLYGQETSDTTQCPCCTPTHRQFDFWIGEWIAYDLQKEGEVVAGTNRIVLLQDSCILQENWVSRGGVYTGTSYNWYDSRTNEWHQSWIDNQGGSLQLSGGIEQGKMVLRSNTMKNRKGETYINRIIWTPNPDGSVRQHWEISRNDGKTWETVFDGKYVKKENKRVE